MRNFNRDVFTTGEVAELCSVASRTVTKWFDSGRLKGFRVPGSTDRRIPRNVLIAFMREHKIPLPKVLVTGTRTKCVLLTQDAVFTETCARELRPSEHFTLFVTESGFEAGIEAESMGANCIVVDFGIGVPEAKSICLRLRRSPDRAWANIILVALVDESNARGLDRSLVNETFKKPIDPVLLAQRLCELVSA